MLIQRGRLSIVLLLACFVAIATARSPASAAPLHGGAAAVDVTPTQFPVLVNGYFNPRTANRAHDRPMSRAIVLDDGSTRLAIVVVDNLMMPRDLLDRAKEMASRKTKIPPERMLISATHTHAAPAVKGGLDGQGPDGAYVEFLPRQIARSIVLANERLRPVKIGWTVLEDRDHTGCRRWVFRWDRLTLDPLGEKWNRAGAQNIRPGDGHLVGPAGPADCDLSLIALQTTDGRPLAVLGNYAMHFVGAPPVSGDFCGRFGQAFAREIGVEHGDGAFVGIMSQGTSGDSQAHWGNLAVVGLDAYTQAVAKVAAEAYANIKFLSDVTLAMAETKIRLQRRVPNDCRLAWAKSVLDGSADPAKAVGFRAWGLHKIYAQEQLYLHEKPEVELKLQALRIGDLGITAWPNEVYSITGLKTKLQSPLPTTLNIELANGAEGYIPPPEQHALGGYTTWPARSAGLEVEAEPKLVDTMLDLLERVSGKPRKAFADPKNKYATTLLDAKPWAYWRLGEIAGDRAADASGNGRDAAYEPGTARYLPGPAGSGLSAGPRGNRAVHIAGGRIRAEAELGNAYSVELWVWNGLPTNARAVTGYFFSRGPDGDNSAAGDHLGIGGTHQPGHSGRLIVFNGNEKNEVLVGKTELPLRKWNHIAMVRANSRVRVYLNGNPTPEIDAELTSTVPKGSKDFFLGGRSDNAWHLEGKLDEVAIYDRLLGAQEITAHFRVARPGAKSSAIGLQPVPQPAPSEPKTALAALHVRDGFKVVADSDPQRECICPQQ